MDTRDRKRVSAAPGAWEAALREKLEGVELPRETTPPVVIPGTLSTRRRRRRFGWVVGVAASVAAILLVLLLSPQQSDLPVPLPVDDPVATVPSVPQPTVEPVPETSVVTHRTQATRRISNRKSLLPLAPIRSGGALLAMEGGITPGRPSRFVPQGVEDETPSMSVIRSSDFSLPETPARTSSSRLLA